MQFLCRRSYVLLFALGFCTFATPSSADNLYFAGNSVSLAIDQRASRPGDLVTVVIVQTAEASTTVRTGSRRSSSIGGSITAGAVNESGSASIGGSFEGQGSASRSERFLTQMTAKVTRILPNGDLEITGTQLLKINGETTTVEVRGLIRPIDIDADNRVPSNRIADAQINYKGKGVVSRSARPGLLHQIFTLFGLL